MTKDERNCKIVNLYKNNESITQSDLASKFDLSRGYISVILNKNNVKCSNRKYSINHNSFNVLDEETEYWIGFLLADGSVIPQKVGNGYRVQLVLQSSDIEHLKKFKSFLDAENPVRTYSNYCRIIFTSSKIVKDLSNFGVVPNKTGTAKPKGKLVHSRNFWRGVIDGDGSLMILNNSVRIDLTGSKETCKAFKNWQIDFGSSKSSVRSRSRTKNDERYTFVVQGEKARNIIYNLYHESNIHLDRKKKLSQKII